MTREEAIEILKDSYERLAMLAHGGLYPDEREELRKAFEALFNPQPDPITGLVPCGCGGKAILKKGINYHSGYYVICEKCECNIGLDRDDFLRPFGAYPTAEQAVSDWDRAIGWKGGAE